MSFFLVFIILAWFILWPILSFAYFKAQNSDTPSSPSVDFSSLKMTIAPRIVEDETVLMMKLGESAYYLEDKEVARLIKALRSTQMTVQTMNEVQALE